ncbi:helix-turn-helix transcriptional regulator [Paenibacillus antri]|uniref:Helix-turn-helix transcriptional regulator n=1 Tax=Paenibacillus antri TaxID=2582848 RepID=A0A5R9G9A3_9BACL|nr:AraC family transcriptional regulator [Paenibacillus antri]TLS51659.1 helix-turn-helix transcriptional regulator [Paenibacillus antri]
MIADRVRVHHCIFAGPQPGFMMSEQISKYNALLSMESGSFEYEIGDRTGVAAFGDLVFCPTGVNFKRRALSAVSFHHIQFELTPDPDDARPPLLPEVHVKIRDTNRLQSTFSYLKKLQRSRFADSPEARSARDRLFADLLLLCELESMQTDAARRPIDPLMQRAMDLIQREALSGDLKLQDVAERIGLHPSRLTRRFQSVYGTTPAAYVTKVRLDEAKRLLVETNDTLESIAYRCGYESGSYFCRAFTDKIGVNPSAFRHNHWI